MVDSCRSPSLLCGPCMGERQTAPAVWKRNLSIHRGTPGLPAPCVLWETQGGRGVCSIDGASRFGGKKIPGFRRGNCVDDHSWFLELLKQGTTSWVAQNNGSWSFHSSGSQMSDIKALAGQHSLWNLGGHPSLLHYGFWWLAPIRGALWLATTSSQSLPPSSKGILSTGPSSYENIGPVGLGPPVH